MKHFISRKPRVLVIIAHFDEMRQYRGRPNFFPQGVGHAFLAGAFEPARVDVRLYSEVYSGPLEDRDLMAWPDMVVFTGVTASFDRMRQITAHVRLLAPHAIVVAGGPAARCLPSLAAEFFDVVCDGDIEELAMVAADVLGPGCVAADMRPRFDLLEWKGPVNYVESSRYCNFKCSFCSLTGERRALRVYDLDYIEHQIRVQPRGRYLLFIDNNFYGGPRAAYHARLELLRKLHKEGLFKGWIALMTSDFFARPENLGEARAAGCVGIFSGLESLDPAQLARYDKRQNLAVSQLAAIETCLKAGIVYQYGMMFDPANQRVADMAQQLDFVIEHDRIPMPAFMSLTIPLLGTPEFDRVVAEGGFLPRTRLRDMDGVTLVTRPQDPMPKAVEFVRKLNQIDWARRRILTRSWRFFRRYRGNLTAAQMSNLLFSGLRHTVPTLKHNNMSLRLQRQKADLMTYDTRTQSLGRLYVPLMAMPPHLRGHFEPTMVTDAACNLHSDMSDQQHRLAVREAATGPSRLSC